MLELIYNPAEFTAWETNMQTALPAALRMTASTLRVTLPQIVKETFLSFMSASNFPNIYANHIITCLNRLPIEVIVAGFYVEAFINLEALGTWEDLARGYHRGALLADIKTQNGPGSHHSGHISDYKLKLPYTGQLLYNETRLDKRVAFWEKIVAGDSVEIGSGQSRVTVNTSGLYDETLLDRVGEWGDKAPEWLLLQWGSHVKGTGAEPQIRPQPVLETLQGIFQEECDIVFGETMALAIATLPGQGSSAETFTLRGVELPRVHGSAQNILGQFTKTRV